MPENPRYGGFEPEEIISEKDRALGGDPAYWEKGGRNQKGAEKTLEGPAVSAPEKPAEEVKKTEKNPPKAEEAKPEPALALGKPTESVAEAPAEKPKELPTRKPKKSQPVAKKTKDAKKPAAPEKPAGEEIPMAQFPSMVEGEPAEKQKTKEGREAELAALTLEDGLDTKEFQEYLNNRPGGKSAKFSETSKEKLRQELELFKAIKSTGKKLGEFYKTELSSVFGVEIGEKELAPISDFLKKEAAENPGRLRERVAEIKEYDGLKKDVASLEEEIKKLGGAENYEAAAKKMAEEQQAVEKRLGVIKWSTGWRGFLNPKNSELLGWAFRARESGEASGLRREMRRESGWIANIFFTSEASKKYFAGLSKRIEELAGKRKVLGEYPFRKDYLELQFNAMKQDFFMKFEPAKALLEAVKDKSLDQISRLIFPGGDKAAKLEGLEKAQARLEVLGKAKEIFDFTQLKELSLGEFQNTLDRAMEDVVAEKISEKVRGLKIGNKSFSKLREQLNDYLTREVLGSKGKKETREFVGGILKTEMHRLAKDGSAGNETKLAYLKVILSDLVSS